MVRLSSVIAVLLSLICYFRIGVRLRARLLD